MNREKKGSNRFHWNTGLSFKNANRRFNDIPQPISWQTDIRNSPLLDNIFISTPNTEVSGGNKIDLIQCAILKQRDSFQRISWSTINLSESAGTSEPNMKTEVIIPCNSRQVPTIGQVKERKKSRTKLNKKKRMLLKAELLKPVSPNQRVSSSHMPVVKYDNNITFENNKLSVKVKTPLATSSLDDSVILVGAVYKPSSSNNENPISPGNIVEDTKLSVESFTLVENIYPKDSDELVDLTRLPVDDIKRNKQTKSFDKLQADDSEVLVDLIHEPGISNNEDIIMLGNSIEKVTKNPVQASTNSMDDSIILLDESYSDASPLNSQKRRDSGSIMVISDTEDEINTVEVVSRLPNSPVTSTSSKNLNINKISSSSKDLEIVCVKKSPISSEITEIPKAQSVRKVKKRKSIRRSKKSAQNTVNKVLKNSSNQQQCKNTDVIPVDFSFTKQFRNVRRVNQKNLPYQLGPFVNNANPAIPNCGIFSGLEISLSDFTLPPSNPQEATLLSQTGTTPKLFKFRGERRLRPIVIDASNVAMSHGQHKKFSCAGIELCIKYFQDRGHKEITAFVPQHRRNRSKDVEGQNILELYHLNQTVVFTPSRKIDGKQISSYDDRFILDFAAMTGGVIVSNDNYRDIKNEKPEWVTAVNDRLLMYLFVGNIFMVPEDPLGRAGIKLDDFLSFRS